MNLNEELVSRWIAHEAVAAGILMREGELFLFPGNENMFMVEVRAIELKDEPMVRLMEEM